MTPKVFNFSKKLSLWNKIKYLNHNIFRTQCCKPLIFQTQITWSNRIHSLKYLRYATFGSKDKVIRKSEFVAKTQFLSQRTRRPQMKNKNLDIKFGVNLCMEGHLKLCLQSLKKKNVNQNNSISGCLHFKNINCSVLYKIYLKFLSALIVQSFLSSLEILLKFFSIQIFREKLLFNFKIEINSILIEICNVNSYLNVRKKYN